MQLNQVQFNSLLAYGTAVTLCEYVCDIERERTTVNTRD